MPPKFKYTREEIISSALDVTRKNGIQGLTARALANELGCSVKPIFGLFKNMEEVQTEVILSAANLYYQYLQDEMSSGKYPPYKASGMGYIRFAKEEKELFKLVFMRDRTNEEKNDTAETAEVVKILQNAIGLTEEQAYKFHLEMWIYVHGIATMMATSYCDFELDYISDLISDMYLGLKHQFTKDKGN